MRLALSGGGFRATLFHLGVICYLREHNLLSNVTEISSVSGGSIFAAHLVQNWEAYINKDSDIEFRRATKHLLQFIASDLRGQVIKKWATMSIMMVAVIAIPFTQVAYWTSFHWGWTSGIFLWSLTLAALLYGYWRKRPLIFFLQKEYDVFFDSATVSSLNMRNRPRLKILATNMTTGGIAFFDSDGITVHHCVELVSKPISSQSA